jgi:hypothetical protein
VQQRVADEGQEEKCLHDDLTARRVSGRRLRPFDSCGPWR